LNYGVEFRPVAKRQAARLPRQVQVELSRLVERLVAEPRFRGVKPVTGRPGVLRARVGDYRVLFKIDDARHMVVIGRIALRDRVYKRLSDLRFD
jgi:mRNA interferase RelE/StbE